MGEAALCFSEIGGKTMLIYLVVILSVFIALGVCVLVSASERRNLRKRKLKKAEEDRKRLMEEMQIISDDLMMEMWSGEWTFNMEDEPEHV